MIYNSDRGQEGRIRLLTLGEVHLIRRVFGNKIETHKVWVNKASYLPFNLQRSDVGMAPSGELFVRDALYSDDYSKESKADQHFFIHEMAHILQQQKGVFVRTRGMLSWAAEYYYDLDGQKKLSDYNIEQQACIYADYFYLQTWGENAFFMLRARKYTGVIDAGLSGKYKAIL